MDSNELTIRLFYFASALPFVIEAAKSKGRQRLGFSGVAVMLGMLGMFWKPLAVAFPIVAASLGEMAASPTNWFTLAALIYVAARYGHRFRSIGQRQEADTPPTAVGVPVGVERRLTIAQEDVRSLIERVDDLDNVQDRLGACEGSVTALLERSASDLQHIERLQADMATVKADHASLTLQFQTLVRYFDFETALIRIVAEMDELAPAVYGGEPPGWKQDNWQADDEATRRFEAIDALACLIVRDLEPRIPIPTDAGRYPFFDPTSPTGFSNGYQTGTQLQMRLRYDHHLLKEALAKAPSADS